MALFDDYLQAFRRRVSPTQRAGGPSTAVWGGLIEQKESNPKLIGSERYRTFSNILSNTTIAAAGVRYFIDLISRAEWHCEPAEDSGEEGEEIAETIEEIINDLARPWRRVVRRAAMFKFFGWGLQEWTAKLREDGTIGLLDIEPRANVTIDRWDVDENGVVNGWLQDDVRGIRQLYIPRAKCIYLVDDALNDSPEGLGLFRHIVEPAQRLARYEQLEGYGFEADLRGVPVGRAPLIELKKMIKEGAISKEEAEAHVDALRKFLKGHVKNPQLSLLFDSKTYVTTDDKKSPSQVPQWAVELLKSEASGQADIAVAIQRINREIARVLGIEALLLGESGAGSLAMHKDKSKGLAMLCDGTLQEIREGMDKDLIGPLFELNGWDPKLKPKFKTDALQHREIEEITSALKDMAAAGALLPPDDPAINVVRDLLGLPKQDLEKLMIDAVLPQQPMMGPDGMPMMDENGKPMMAPASRASPDNPKDQPNTPDENAAEAEDDEQ